MSFLTPLYLLGALTIAGPVIFHLIRRTPRGEVPFSTLMFLSPTPPRLTRRSRISDWLLLLLRVAALCLLAFAFARPFLRETVALDSADGEARRVLVLIDVSASLRRGDLWSQSQNLAEAALRETRPNDDVAVYAFDRSVRPVLTYAESATLEPARRSAIANSRVAELAPTWAATDFGTALVEAVGIIEDLPDSTAETTRMPRRIVLVSDLQEGAALKSLGSFEWPSDVELELKTVEAARANAGLRRLADASEPAVEDGRPALRVQVTNEVDATAERFTLEWKDASDTTVGKGIDAYVPAGQSRVFRVKKPEGDVVLRSLELRGDAHPFDNAVFIADQPKAELSVLYVGDDPADDPNGPLYYLERVFQDTAERAVRVVRHSPQDAIQVGSPQAMPLIVVAATVPVQSIEALREFMITGGTVLCVLTAPELAASAAQLTELSLGNVEEAAVDRDVMLGEIAFRHPLFSQLAAAQYNDFTKIRFWKYRRIDRPGMDDARMIARFENGDPAIVERLVGKGRAILFTSGWSPADSQLARSSKFVPLMMSLLSLSDPQAFEASDLHVGDAVSLSSIMPSSAPTEIFVGTPSGGQVRLPADATSFDATAEPGLYAARIGDERRSFVVNLDPAESRTLPLPVETLEQYGVKVARGPAVARNETETKRQLLNAELEGRQKLWRWIVLATIGVLLMETWLAGRLARTRRSSEEVLLT
ncbi:MAG: BatA domain-containing protein [Planctomycetaceae bacterium]|nr:BatA domain-containing protein [Planctomycetaceae bacterium]